MVAAKSDVTRPVSYSEYDPPKSVIQDLQRLFKRGKLKECPCCDGTGRRNYVDAAGDVDDEDCRYCEGWSVVEITNKVYL